LSLAHYRPCVSLANQRRAFLFGKKARHIMTMTIDLERKNVCIQSLRKALIRTRNWRRGLKARFPDDPKLDECVATLDKIAAQAGELSDEAYLAILPHFDWASKSWADSVSLAARRVAYSLDVTTFSAFISTLITILRVQK
jgi:hypothetical protein